MQIYYSRREGSLRHVNVTELVNSIVKSFHAINVSNAKPQLIFIEETKHLLDIRDNVGGHASMTSNIILTLKTSID